MAKPIDKTKPAVSGGGHGTRGSVRFLDYTLMNILRQLPSGQRISMSNLAAARGCTERELRARIEALRRAGYPILSSTAKGGSGYWLDPAPEAVKQWKARTVRRAVKIIGLANAVQLELWEGDDENNLDI
ncbi:HTH domain-containing protein [Thermanaerothrix sp. 4228-RoL]|uniref:HTH domain-containing protein n=1 Tax=Thermanaerothrix solaris TaxID=3058434 RepID=A0ABU3NKB1_9CHLR|nr:HTH domain-containing protein [Thermanaerothrix sp. 4228-RoL]MDT8896770.1 HTH domain-containing protein [Thermanaerothrix sp. 4228-RoL]